MDLPTENTVVVSEAPFTARPVEKLPGIWSGLGIVALYFLLQFGSSLLAGVAIGFALALKAGIEAGLHHARPDTRAIVQSMQGNPDIQVTVAVVTIVSAAVAVMLLVRRFWPAQWSRAEPPGFGFVRPADQRAYPAAVLLGIAVLLLGSAITQLLSGHHQVHQDVAVMAGKVTPGLRVLLALLVVGVAPVIEELVFRGVLLSGLASRMHAGLAIVASAVIFGCVHLPDFGFAWYPVPSLVLLGLALAWLRVRTHSLWPSITLHATNNFFAVIGWFVVASH